MILIYIWVQKLIYLCVIFSLCTQVFFIVNACCLLTVPRELFPPNAECSPPFLFTMYLFSLLNLSLSFPPFEHNHLPIFYFALPLLFFFKSFYPCVVFQSCSVTYLFLFLGESNFFNIDYSRSFLCFL